MWNREYRGTVYTEESRIWRANYKLYSDFQLCGGLATLIPVLFKGQLYFISFYCQITCYCMDIPYLIYSSVDGRLSCFQFLAIMSNATMNIHVQVFVQTCFHFSWAFFILDTGYMYLFFLLFLKIILLED